MNSSSSTFSKRPAAKTLPRVVSEVAAIDPGRVAIYYHDAVVTYGLLNRTAQQIGKALIALGVARGDRVAILLGNQPEWLMACLGAGSVGATLVPLSTWYKPAEIEWALHRSQARVLIAASWFLKTDYVGLLTRLIPELIASRPGSLRSEALPGLETVVFVGSGAPDGQTWEALLHLGEHISAQDFQSRLESTSPDDAAFILYTSGSTAEPKGVVLCHRGLVENGFDIGERRLIGPDDRIWLGSPLFYGLGAANALPVGLTHGSSLVLQDYFDPAVAIESISQCEATVYYGAGNMTQAILDHSSFRRSKVGSLRKGNAGITAEYKRLTLVDLGVSLATQAYGLTETYGHVTGGVPDDPLEVKLRTDGRPLPGMELSIVDPQTFRQLPIGEAGLILVRGHTTTEYFGDSLETKRVRCPDGFFDTGDIGHIDNDGRLVFRTRLKEIIKVGGITVSPAEVEAVLVQHPEVRTAIVVGIPDRQQGEALIAFVDSKRPLTEREVKEFVRLRTASFKVPTRVLFRSEERLPRLASGKVAKYLLRKEAIVELAPRAGQAPSVRARRKGDAG